MTVLFVDRVDSTAQAETLDPEDVRELHSLYFARVRSEIEHYGGVVEKFIGDAVVGLFGAPFTHVGMTGSAPCAQRSGSAM